MNSPHNPDYEKNVEKFKEDYNSLLSNPLISPFLSQKVVKYLFPCEIPVFQNKVAEHEEKAFQN